MSKPNQQLRFVPITLLLVYVCVCQCTCDNPVEPVTGTDDYIENVSAFYKNEILLVENQIAQMELACSKEISVVIHNQEIMTKIARQLESRMRSVATLNIKSKLCIQHFIGNVTTENVNLQTKLRACVDAAKGGTKTIADNAKVQVRNARAQLSDLMKVDVVACHKTHGTNQQKLTDCVRDKLRVRETNMQAMMKNANKDVEHNICKVDIVARTAQECSLFLVLDTVSMLSEMVSTINTCIGDRLLEMKST